MKKTSEMTLDELLEKIDELQNNKALSDEFLIDRGCRTRDEIGIGEYSYGIIMMPVDFIFPYLEELRDIKKEKIKCNQNMENVQGVLRN